MVEARQYALFLQWKQVDCHSSLLFHFPVDMIGSSLSQVCVVKT